MKQISDNEYVAALDALGEALAARGKPNHSRQAATAARRAIGLLAPLMANKAHPRGGKRGPKPRFDQDWAGAQLLDLVIRDPDGMPQSQSILVDHLHLAFAAKGNGVPCRTWLRNAVRDFCSRANAHDRATREKFRNSPALVSLFQSENEYVVFTRIRDRLAEKWWREKALQISFSSASEYVAAMLDSDGKNSAIEAFEIVNNSDTPSQ